MDDIYVYIIGDTIQVFHPFVPVQRILLLYQRVCSTKELYQERRIACRSFYYKIMMETFYYQNIMCQNQLRVGCNCLRGSLYGHATCYKTHIANRYLVWTAKDSHLVAEKHYCMDYNCQLHGAQFSVEYVQYNLFIREFCNSDQTVDAYSSCGLASDLYANSLTILSHR